MCQRSSPEYVDYNFRYAWNTNRFIILPLTRVETFSQNVAHAPYRDENLEKPSLIQREVKALT
jgi:hypothetical protein